MINEQSINSHFDETLALDNADTGRDVPVGETLQIRDRLKLAYNEGKASGPGRNADPAAILRDLKSDLANPS